MSKREHNSPTPECNSGTRRGRTFCEFFAGGGMARAGLGDGWRCLFANDIDPKKGASYTANWGTEALRIADVAEISTRDFPDSADLAWASFPCQDLSLAGAGAGLKGAHSGTFWPFWELIQALGRESRAPRLIVLENVCGALTSYDGKDFGAICTALAGENYRFGGLVMDAVHFVPQSRARLFIVAVHDDFPIPTRLIRGGPDTNWHSERLVDAFEKLPARAKKLWVWWCLPAPPVRAAVFADLIEEKSKDVTWHTPAETRQLLDIMSQGNLRKVEQAKRGGRRVVGTIYKRARADGNGRRVLRAEVRFDDIAGCLRTPVGGSSRQTIIIVDGRRVRSRLLSPREAARLMGLSDSYKLPENYNEAYHLAGDGLVVPVVRFLAAHVLEPLLSGDQRGAAT